LSGPNPDLPIAAQCRLLKVARSTLYYRPLPVSVDDLRLMRWLDDRREAAVRLSRSRSSKQSPPARFSKISASTI
jgi:hypothetical protein